MNSLLGDIRYGARVLLKNPVATSAAVLILALGIGVNLAIFSFANAIWLRPLPVRHPEQIVRIFTSCRTQSGIDPRCSNSLLDLQDVQQQTRSLSAVGSSERRGGILVESGETSMLMVSQVSDNWLELLGIQAEIGRIFTAAEQQQPATPPELMISYSFWKKHFGGEASVIGRTINFNGRTWTIIGVLPKGFRGTESLLDPELTIPLSSARRASGRSEDADREYRRLDGFARLRDGAAVATLNAELATISARLRQGYPKSNRDSQITALIETESRGAGKRLLSLMLMGIAGLVLMIACANVANLLFARGEHRRPEIATRLALGATRVRILRQFVVENAMLAAAAVVGALVIGSWTIDFIPKLVADLSVPISIDTRLGGGEMLFALAGACVSIFVFGLAPALSAAQTSVLSTLKSQMPGSGGAARRPWVRDTLVVVQISVSALLVVCTGLLLRTLVAMEAADPGFSAHQPMLIADVISNPVRRATASETFLALQQSVGALPGVKTVAMANRLPLSASGGGRAGEVLVPGKLQPDGRGINVKSAYVSSGYFEALGTRLLRGRTFAAADDQPTSLAAVVNQTMARTFWGEENAVGQHFKIGKSLGRELGKEFEVIGVVEDGKYNQIYEDPAPYMFLNIGQYRGDEVSIVITTSTDPAALAAPVRALLRDKHGMAVMRLSTMREFMRLSMFANRLAAQLVGVMGVLGMLLAAVGLYGVIAYLVGTQTREIGIRMALGASRIDILSMFIGRGLMLAGVGIGIGIAFALAASRAMASLLFGVSARDPLTYFAAMFVCLTAACAATYFPSLRATRIEPIEALRYE